MTAVHVTPAYHHRDKAITPRALFASPVARLKWYDVHAADTVIPDDIRECAKAYLPAAHASLELDCDLGFVILHRCGQDFYFLILSTWRNENEMWESVYYKDGDAMADFAPWTPTGRHRPTYCVWELGVVVHEKAAWTQFLRSARDGAAIDAWERSLVSGIA